MEIERLCQLPGVSGDEFEVQAYLADCYQRLGLTLKRDRLGSVFGEREVAGSPFNVMISANLDEVGGIIDGIEANGLLSFVPVSAQAEQFNRQCVHVLTRTHQIIRGYTLQRDSRYLIDIGCHQATAVDALDIKIGDTFVLDLPTYRQGEHLFSKNLNNRLGLWVAHDVMQKMMRQGAPLPYTLAIGGIAQSRVGYRGAITATNLIQPEIALVLDTAYVRDYQPNSIYLRYFDKTLLPNRQLLERLKTVATRLGYQVIGQLQDDGTDGSFIHKTQLGAATLVVVIPMAHSRDFMQSVDWRDVAHLVEVLTAFLTELDATTVSALTFQEAAYESVAETKAGDLDD